MSVAAAAPAAGATIAKGVKIVIKLAMILSAVYLTKKELDNALQDTTPLLDGEDDLPSKVQRDITAIYPEAKNLFNMVQDMFKGDYRAEDPLAITTAVLSMGYLFSPVENPETMEISDIKAISYAAGVCAKELKRYQETKGQVPVGSGTAIISAKPYESAGDSNENG